MLPDGISVLLEAGQLPGLQQQREVAYALLFRLAGCAPEAVGHDAQGRPFLPSRPGLGISVSHCHGAVAAAVSERGAVGIDVECRRRVNPALVRRVCTEAEQGWIAAQADPQMAFLDLWTRKEAALKCRGTGIRGFGSMVEALADEGIRVESLPTPCSDMVASVAYPL